MTAAVGRLAKWGLGGYFWLLVVFLYTPLVVLMVFSFNDNRLPVLPLEGFTTKWYERAFDNSEMVDAVKLSLRIAFLNAILATMLGMIAALGLAAKRLPGRSIITAILMLPLVVPYIVIGIGLLIVVNDSFGQSIGLEQSATAVLLGHLVISVPYTVLVILPRIRTLDSSLTEAGRDLGSSNVGAFWRITRPLITPALVSSAIIAFIISFDEYVIASFLVAPGDRTFPIFLYSGSKVPEQRPELLALGAVVIMASMVLVLLTEVGRRWAEHRQTGG